MKVAWLIAGVLFYTSVASAAPLSDFPLRVDGIGPLTIGMTKKEAEAATHMPITLASNAEPGCDTGEVGDSGLSVMIEKDVITRISTGGSYATAEGIKVNDKEDKLLAIYSNRLSSTSMNRDQTKYGYSYDELILRNHTYLDPGHYILIHATNDMGYMFETDGTQVTSIHTGQYSSVGYGEGCL